MNTQEINNKIEILTNAFDYLLNSDWLFFNNAPSTVISAANSSYCVIGELLELLTQKQTGESLLSSLKLIIDGEKSKGFFQFIIHVELKHFIFLVKNECINNGHGGARKGAGRKKSMPTVQTRVPESLLPFINQLTDNFKLLDMENDKALITYTHDNLLWLANFIEEEREK